MTPSMIEDYMDAHFNDYTPDENSNISNVSQPISVSHDAVHKQFSVRNPVSQNDSNDDFFNQSMNRNNSMPVTMDRRDILGSY